MRFLPPVLLLVLILAPGAVGQTLGERLGASDRCTQACDAKQANGYAPVQGDDPVRMVLYGHVENVLFPSPMNTQRPDPSSEPDRRLNFSPCAAAPSIGRTSVGWGACELQFFLSPGLVEARESGWRMHQGPGLAYPLPLLGSSVNLHLALSTQTVNPQVAIWARMETGRFVGQGTVLGETRGATPAKTLVNGPGDSHDAFEFVVPLTVVRAEIPDRNLTSGILLTVRVYQVDQSGVTAAQPWQLRVGYKFPPRLVFTTQEPLRTNDLELVRVEDSLYLRWTFESALGAYNVRDELLRLQVDGPMHLSSEAFEHVILKRSIECGGQIKPLTATWKLNHTRIPLVDGWYHLRLSIPTYDESYLLVARTSFEVRDGNPVLDGVVEFKGAATTPGPDVLAFAMFLLGALAWRRKGKAFQPGSAG